MVRASTCRSFTYMRISSSWVGVLRAIMCKSSFKLWVFGCRGEYQPTEVNQYHRRAVLTSFQATVAALFPEDSFADAGE